MNVKSSVFSLVKFQTSNRRDDMKNTTEKQTPNLSYLAKNDHEYTHEGLNFTRRKHDIFTCIYILIYLIHTSSFFDPRIKNCSLF